MKNVTFQIYITFQIYNFFTASYDKENVNFWTLPPSKRSLTKIWLSADTTRHTNFSDSCPCLPNLLITFPAFESLIYMYAMLISIQIKDRWFCVDSYIYIVIYKHLPSDLFSEYIKAAASPPSFCCSSNCSCIIARTFHYFLIAFGCSALSVGSMTPVVLSTRYLFILHIRTCTF